MSSARIIHYISSPRYRRILESQPLRVMVTAPGVLILPEIHSTRQSIYPDDNDGQIEQRFEL
jgi:hypothetical protein